MGGIMKAKGISDEQFAAVCVIVDKLDKIGADAVIEEMVSKCSVPAPVARSIINTMSARSIKELEDQCAGLSLGPDAQASVDELKSLFDMAKSYGYADYLIFDASVVRGLAYYTGVVFECFDRSGELRAICGGGRYDRLLSLYGAQTEIPCVGFGFGDCVIMELLELKGLVPPLNRQADFLVAPFNQSMVGNAMSVAAALRASGASVDFQGEPKKKIGQTFDYANRIGADFIALVAPGEWEQGLVRIKNLRSENKDANQKDIPMADLPKWRELTWE
uniref:histidine--tRNA ligase n=3 Tax=Hemiselmis andersenii TaxID=464988 RepID=A0A6U5A8K6_HEMAN|mmetsp:Transcript_46544/g.113176  ORF Transcript_46544/g.113176 Transcript_46544/m.113176 type:complete len:276 (+) Transcript_46544:552-1379(+)